MMPREASKALGPQVTFDLLAPKVDSLLASLHRHQLIRFHLSQSNVMPRWPVWHKK